MNELGLAVPFWLLVLIWMARTIWLVFICTILAWLGIRALDALTPHIPHRHHVQGVSHVAVGHLSTRTIWCA